jgi:hypothetical protein
LGDLSWEDTRPQLASRAVPGAGSTASAAPERIVTGVAPTWTGSVKFTKIGGAGREQDRVSRLRGIQRRLQIAAGRHADVSGARRCCLHQNDRDKHADTCGAHGYPRTHFNQSLSIDKEGPGGQAALL